MEETIIKRTEMNIYYLFFEKETYELIMQTYSKNAIAMFNEEASIENVNAKFLQENMLNNYIKKKLVELDKNKPIEKNGEYLFTHFYEPIIGWGSRGTPYLWQAIAREFSNDRVSDFDKKTFEDKYLNVFYLLTNVDLRTSAEEFYCEDYAHGGMSSGVIFVNFFREELKFLLQLFDN